MKHENHISSMIDEFARSPHTIQSDRLIIIRLWWHNIFKEAKTGRKLWDGTVVGEIENTEGQRSLSGNNGTKP